MTARAPRRRRESGQWAATLPIPVSEVTFGQAVRWAREQRRLTLRQLGERLGVSAVYLCDIEHDRRGQPLAAELAKVLGVRLVDLEARSGLTPDLKDWLSKRPDLIAALREVQRGRQLVLKGVRRRG